MDMKRAISTVLIGCLEKAGAKKTELDLCLGHATDYIYDSIDTPICETSFYIRTSSVEVEVYSVTDNVDGKHKSATYKHSLKCIDAGDFLMEDTINSLKMMNLEVRIRALGGKTTAQVAKFKQPLFMREIIKVNDRDTTEYLFTRITRSLADFHASDYHAQYRPARNSDYITENNSVTLMLAEYLQCALVSSAVDGWAPFSMPTTEMRVRTKLPNKSIASYRGILEDAGYIQFSGLSTSLIHLEKSFELINGRPLGSRSTAKRLQRVYSDVYHQK